MHFAREERRPAARAPLSEEDAETANGSTEEGRSAQDDKNRSDMALATNMAAPPLFTCLHATWIPMSTHYADVYTHVYGIRLEAVSFTMVRIIKPCR